MSEEIKTNLEKVHNNSNEEEETKIKEKIDIPLSKWTVDDVCQWLMSEESCEEMVSKFKEYKIKGELFLRLDGEDLKSMEINKKIERTRLLCIRDKIITYQEHASTQFHFGKCYYNGKGVEQDYKEAVKWYRKAADQGHTKAQLKLSSCYYNGNGVEKNAKEVVKWYRKAAEQGNSDAQNKLGVCYHDAKGVEQDYKEALRWYRKAVDQDNVWAQYNIGFCYKNGQGVKQDYKKAVEWFRKSADQGNESAQYSLGICYDYARGVVQDYKEAVKWYRKAAEQGNSKAQNSLGICYKNGQGVAKNVKKAIEWFKKAVDNGHTEAQTNLAMCNSILNEKESEPEFEGKDEVTDVNKDQCCICLTNKKCICFFPCSHIATCMKCSKDIKQKCPICKQNINDKFKVFF